MASQSSYGYCLILSYNFCMSSAETNPEDLERQPKEGYIEYTFRGPKLDLSSMSTEERDAALRTDFQLASGSPYKPNGSYLNSVQLVITEYLEDS